MKLRGFLDQLSSDTVLIEQIRARPGSVLTEAVLHVPAEVALKPFIDRIGFEAGKKWVATNLKNFLLKQPENLFQLTYLPRNATPKQAKAFEFKDLYDLRPTPNAVTMIEHIIDWFEAKQREANEWLETQRQLVQAQGNNPTAEQMAQWKVTSEKLIENPIPNLERMTPQQVISMADAEIAAYNKRNAATAAKPEAAKNFKVLMEFPGGYKMVELLNQAALDREGNLMGHCIGTHHGVYMKDKSRRMFSLRGPNNDPHASIEIDTSTKGTTEIKGKGNAPPVRRYWSMLIAFLEQMGFTANHDYLNLGLLKVMNPITHQVDIMTMHQFKDMVHDPDNEQGKAILANAQSLHAMDTDTLIGLFDAMYGTPEMTDAMLERVMAKAPDHAVTVIEHYGNKLSYEQTAKIIAQLGAGVRGYGQENTGQQMIARVLAVSPNDPELYKKILNDLDGKSDGDYRNNSRYSSIANNFVTGLIKAKPQMYTDLILSSPEQTQKELEHDATRSSGPYFIYMRNDKDPTPRMIERAFQYDPNAAMKTWIKFAKVATLEQTVAMMKGIYERHSSYSRGEEDVEELDKVFTWILESGKVTPEQMNAFVDEISKPDEDGKSDLNDRQKKALVRIMSISKSVNPNLIHGETLEKLIISIGDTQVVANYLIRDPKTSERMQEYAYAKARNDDTKLLPYVQTFDAKYWAETYDILKINWDDYDLTKQVHHQLKKERTVKGPEGGTYKSSTYTTKVPLDGAELETELMKIRHKVTAHFINRFGRMLIQPPTKPDQKFNPSMLSPTKTNEARAWFKSQGKEATFNTAMKRIGREDRVDQVHREGKASSGDTHYTPEVQKKFASVVHTLPIKDIARLIIDVGGWGNRYALFADLVALAPEKVPDVIAAGFNMKHGYSSDKIYLFGDLDQKNLDKDKLFDAVEAVWKSDLAEHVKDRFTEAAFKRFKPPAKRLMSMIQASNNTTMLEYILKKTKNPGEELIKVIYERDPGLLDTVALAKIPSSILTDAAKNQPGLFRSWMTRDLRGWRSTNTRSKHSSYAFHDLLDTDSPEFHLLRKAAAEAGKVERFDKWVIETQHEEAHGGFGHSYGRLNGQITANNRPDKNVPDFAAIKKNISEYSLKSLMHFMYETKITAKQDVDHYSYSRESKIDPKLRQLYIENLSILRLYQVIQAGLFAHVQYSDHVGNPDFSQFDLISPERLSALMTLALKDFSEKDADDKKVNEQAKAFVAHAIKTGYEFTSDQKKSVLISVPDEKLRAQILSDADDEMKDWVATEKPELMGSIPKPNATMVRSLFDNYAKVRMDQGKQKINYTFMTIANRWFVKKIDHWDHTFIPNPEAHRLMVEEAKRRGGISIAIMQAFLRNLAKVREDDADRAAGTKDKYNSKFKNDSGTIKPSVFKPKPGQIDGEE